MRSMPTIWLWGEAPVLRIQDWPVDFSPPNPVSIDALWREFRSFVASVAADVSKRDCLDERVRRFLAAYAVDVCHEAVPDEVVSVALEDFGWYVGVLMGRRNDIENALGRGDVDEIVSRVATCVPSLARAARLHTRRRRETTTDNFIVAMDSSYDETPLARSGARGSPCGDQLSVGARRAA